MTCNRTYGNGCREGKSTGSAARDMSRRLIGSMMLLIVEVGDEGKLRDVKEKNLRKAGSEEVGRTRPVS